MTVRRRPAGLSAAAVLTAVVLVTGCGNDDGDRGGDGDVSAPTSASSTISTEGAIDDERFPEIVDVVATRAGDGSWTFDVTVSSPDDTPERYADGWRVVGADGTVYGEHTLTHDHANEQPFTRTQSGVDIPDEVDEVTIEGRDLVNGFGGRSVTVTLGAD